MVVVAMVSAVVVVEVVVVGWLLRLDFWSNLNHFWSTLDNF